MLSDLKCIPERKKNSLERAVFLFHCVQSAAKGFQQEKVREQKWEFFMWFPNTIEHLYHLFFFMKN